MEAGENWPGRARGGQDGVQNGPKTFVYHKTTKSWPIIPVPRAVFNPLKTGMLGEGGRSYFGFYGVLGGVGTCF